MEVVHLPPINILEHNPPLPPESCIIPRSPSSPTTLPISKNGRIQNSFKTTWGLVPFLGRNLERKEFRAFGLWAVWAPGCRH